MKWQQIIDEIKHTAAANHGAPLGVARFLFFISNNLQVSTEGCTPLDCAKFVINFLLFSKASTPGLRLSG